MKSTNIIHTTHNTPPNVSNVREKGGDLVINALNTTFESLIVNCTIYRGFRTIAWMKGHKIIHLSSASSSH